MTNTRQELAKAFELIKKDQLDDAIIIVKPITEREPDNADGWWLLANASNEPRDARRALVQTLKINPSYPKARDLLDKLNELYPPRDDELMMMMAIEDVEQPIPTGDDDLFEDDGGYGELDDLDALFSQAEDDFSDPFEELAPAKEPEKATKLAKKKVASGDDDFEAYPEHENPFEKMLESPEMLSGQQAKPQREGSGLPLRRILIVGLLLIVALAFVGLAVMLLTGGDDGDEATPSYAERTPIEAAALNADQAEALENQRAAIEAGMRAQFDPAATVQFMEAGGDQLVMVEVCSQSNPRLPRLVQDMMGLLAVNLNTAEALRGTVDLAGVEVSDCNNPDDKIYTALAPIEAVNAFNSSSPSDRAEAFRNFQDTWIRSNN